MLRPLSLSLALMAALSASSLARAQDTPTTPPAPAPATPEQTQPPVVEPVPAPLETPAAAPAEPAVGTPLTSAPATVEPAQVAKASATVEAENEHRAALPQRILMDVVSGAAGAGVVLLLGWAVAAPLALLPLALSPVMGNLSPLGVPLAVIFAGGAASAVLVLAIVAGAVAQRLIRPLMGPEPSMLGPVLGALFFGGVGTVAAATAAFLLFTTPPSGLKPMREMLVKDADINAANGRALALVGFVTVAAAVPVGALAAAIGGPLAAEREDALADETGPKKGGASGGPVRN